MSAISDVKRALSGDDKDVIETKTYASRIQRKGCHPCNMRHPRESAARAGIHLLLSAPDGFPRARD